MPDCNRVLSWLMCVFLCFTEPEPLFIDKCIYAQMRWGDWCEPRVIELREAGSMPEATLHEIAFRPAKPCV